jgi:DNA-binding IclR family transcriptional regulator
VVPICLFPPAALLTAAFGKSNCRYARGVKSPRIDPEEIRLYGFLREEPMARRVLVKSAARAFDLLEVFARARRPLRLRDLIDELGWPRSSLAELLKSITSQGYLVFDRDTFLYRPSPRLAALVGWVEGDRFEQSIVTTAMQRLRDATGELVVLGTPNGIHMEYIETLRATEPIQLYIAPGTRRLMVQNVGGWLILARESRESALALYEQTLAEGELTRAEFSADDLCRRLDAHRGRDIAFSTARDYVRPTAHWGGALAAGLVPVPDGHRPLVIGIGGLADRLERKRNLIEAALRTELTRIAVAN